MNITSMCDHHLFHFSSTSMGTHSNTHSENNIYRHFAVYLRHTIAINIFTINNNKFTAHGMRVCVRAGNIVSLVSSFGCSIKLCVAVGQHFIIHKIIHPIACTLHATSLNSIIHPHFVRSGIHFELNKVQTAEQVDTIPMVVSFRICGEFIEIEFKMK